MLGRTKFFGIMAGMADGSIPMEEEKPLPEGAPAALANRIKNSLYYLERIGKLPPHPGLQLQTISSVAETIADFFNPERGCAWPCLRTIVKKAVLARSTCRRARKWLIENGFLLAFSRWRRSDRTEPGETEPRGYERSTMYIPLAAPPSLLGEMSEEEYEALLCDHMDYNPAVRPATIDTTSSPRAVVHVEEGAPNDIAAEPEAPLSVAPAARVAPVETSLDLEVAQAALRLSPTDNDATHSRTGPAAVPLPTPPPPQLPAELRALVAPLQDLERLTSVRLHPSQVMAIGTHFSLTASSTLRTLNEVVEAVSVSHHLGGTVERRRDDLIDKIRRFFRAAGRSGANNHARQLTPAHSPEHIERVAETKKRERVYEEQKAADRASEVAFTQMLADPSFLGMKAFLEGRPVPTARSSERKPLGSQAPADANEQRARDAQWWASQRAALNAPPALGPP